MNVKHDINAIVEQLNKLEQELKDLNLWGGEQARPSEQDLNTTNPFGVDVIEFHQWLEYVLIARLKFMIENSQALPTCMTAHNYAQLKYHGHWTKYRNLIGIIQELDNLITIEK